MFQNAAKLRGRLRNSNESTALEKRPRCSGLKADGVKIDDLVDGWELPVCSWVQAEDILRIPMRTPREGAHREHSAAAPARLACKLSEV